VVCIHSSPPRAVLSVLLLAAAAPLNAQSATGPGAPAPSVSAGLAVLERVHRRYAETRFRTLTFTQRTTFPDGRVEWWYEAESLPGKARVDVAPFADGNAQIFRNDSAYVFRGGELTQRSEGLAATMWTLMDMYVIPPEETAAALARRGFDLSVMHEREHEGRHVIVLGAMPGDTTSAQIWLDREHLFTVKMISPRGGHRVTDVSRHVFMGGGWVEQEIRVYLNGEMTLLEEYFDTRVNVELPADLFEPDRYRTPPWTETRRPGGP
jgi:hypothetical protein